MPKIIVKEPGKEMRVLDFGGVYRMDVKPFIGEDAMLEFINCNSQSGDTFLNMVCDEDGKLKQLPMNFYMLFGGMGMLDRIVGTVCFIRYKWENPDTEEGLDDFKLVDVTDSDIQALRSFLSDRVQSHFRRAFQ